MTTRRKISKRDGKKQSRRMKYGGMIPGMVYESPDLPENFDINDKGTSEKISNNTNWLIGGGLLVALAVGITVPLVLSKK